ncbi:MAG TPA: hypothetical protein VGP12_08250, partial [Nitrosospira sp.]|nr:hypothetical protein [Nitrosospira sp.]
RQAGGCGGQILEIHWSIILDEEGICRAAAGRSVFPALTESEFPLLSFDNFHMLLRVNTLTIMQQHPSNGVVAGMQGGLMRVGAQRDCARTTPRVLK